VGSPVALQIPSEPGPARYLLAGPFSGPGGGGGVCSVDRGSSMTSGLGAEYRRRAQACLDAAHTTQSEPMRVALLPLAEDWQRMAESWDDRPTAQQQQVQPHRPPIKEAMDRQMLAQHLLPAEARVANGDWRVEKQRRLIARLERDGQDTSEARMLLAELEETRKLHIAGRDRLLRELGK